MVDNVFYSTADIIKLSPVKNYEYEPDKITHDIAVDDYNFDNNNKHCSKESGIEIDGFLFFPEEVKGDISYSSRKYNRTKIMSGGEFVSRGQYDGREFSFTTYLEVNPDEPYLYDKIFQIMENKKCEVISPYVGDKFNAEVEFVKTNPKASPRTLKVDVKVKEIVNPTDRLPGDPVFDYPSTNKAISYKKIYSDGKEKQDDSEDTRGKFLREEGVAVNEGNARYSKENRGKYEYNGG